MRHFVPVGLAGGGAGALQDRLDLFAHLCPDLLFGVRGRGERGKQAKHNKGEGGQQAGQGGTAANQTKSALPGANGTGKDRVVGRKARQVVGEFGGAGIAAAGVLFQALQRDRFQVAGQSRREARRRRRFFANDLEHDVHGRIARERQPAGHELIEQDAQRINVRPGATSFWPTACSGAM